MTNKTFKAGQKVRIISDTFNFDPHGLEIGSVYEIDSISPATPFEEFPPMAKLMYLIEGIEPHDLPERVHVKTGYDLMDYGNIVFEDVELVEDGAEGKKIRMLEDDYAEGYSYGDIFEVEHDDEGEAYFFDNDGDARYLEDLEHEII